MKTKIMLKRPEYRELENMVDSHKDEIIAGKWTRRTFAEFASKEMGRPITEAHVSAAAITMKVNFSFAQGSGLKSYLQVRAAVKILAEELINLKGQLGVVITPSLQNLVTSLQRPADQLPQEKLRN